MTPEPRDLLTPGRWYRIVEICPKDPTPTHSVGDLFQCVQPGRGASLRKDQAEPAWVRDLGWFVASGGASGDGTLVTRVEPIAGTETAAPQVPTREGPMTPEPRDLLTPGQWYRIVEISPQDPAPWHSVGDLFQCVKWSPGDWLGSNKANVRWCKGFGWYVATGVAGRGTFVTRVEPVAGTETAVPQAPARETARCRLVPGQWYRIVAISDQDPDPRHAVGDVFQCVNLEVKALERNQSRGLAGSQGWFVAQHGGGTYVTVAEPIAAPDLCPGCGNPFSSPDHDPRCSSCAESGTGPEPAMHVQMTLSCSRCHNSSSHYLHSKSAERLAPYLAHHSQCAPAAGAIDLMQAYRELRAEVLRLPGDSRFDELREALLRLHSAVVIKTT